MPLAGTGNSSCQAHAIVFRSCPAVVAGFALLLGGALLAGCSPDKPENEAAPTVTAQVASAENKSIQQSVVADAVLYPLGQAALVPKIVAPVKKFFVNRGAVVRAGQVLAELESQDLEGAVTENRGGYQQAQAGYDASVQKAQQDLDLAKQVLDAQQKLYDSRQSLFKQGAVAAKDVDDASVTLTQARGQYAAAQKQFDLKVAEGQLTAAKGKAASAEASLSYARITSPIDGVVTDRPFYAGETPPAGTPLITVMNLSQVVARAHVSPQQASAMKVGDAAEVLSAGQETHGKVTLVSPALDPNSTTVEIWVQVPNRHFQLKPGNSARVTIVTETVQHAVVVPAAALLTAADGATAVIELDGHNRPHKQAIKVGIRNTDFVQITDGLKFGDRVVTSGAFELAGEDEDVLAKTTVQIKAPKAPPDGADDDAR